MNDMVSVAEIPSTIEQNVWSPARGLIPETVLNSAISALILLFLSPLLVIVVILIRVTSKGPAIYRQTRIGHHGKHFTLYKFRTMRYDAEVNGAIFASRNDPRITSVGRFLRHHRIDELPQFINVLLGQMAIIGPRPERPIFVTQYALVLSHYQERHRVKPGITGLAQVLLPYGASLEDARDKLACDLCYVRSTRRYMMNLTILWLTVGVVLFRRGAR